MVEATPTTPSDSESVIDRIKRRSYYCRFNEKKPKRISTIVGTAAQRDYYNNKHCGSKSPTPMNTRELSSRATTPFSVADENDKFKGTNSPYFHQYNNRCQTPSKLPYECNETSKVKSSDYLNLRTSMTSPPLLTASNSKNYSTASPSSLPTIDYHLNGNHSRYSLRNSVYDGISSPSIYGL